MAASPFYTSLPPCLQQAFHPSPLLSRLHFHHSRVLSSSILPLSRSLKPAFASPSNGDDVPDFTPDSSANTANVGGETPTSTKDADNLNETKNTKTDVASRKGLNFGFLNLWSRQREEKELEEDLVFDGGEFQIRWRDILDPTPENILALLLTSLLGLAILQIFWQLFLVGITITLAGLKYSVIAVLDMNVILVYQFMFILVR